MSNSPVEKTVSQTFDLKNLFTKDLAANGVEMKIRHPADGSIIKGEDGKPWVVTVIGTDSDKWKELQANIGKKRNQDIDDRATEKLLAGLIVGWRGLVLEGEQLKFTPQAAIKLLIDYPWIRDQINLFANDRTNFLPEAQRIQFSTLDIPLG